MEARPVKKWKVAEDLFVPTLPSPTKFEETDSNLQFDRLIISVSGVKRHTKRISDDRSYTFGSARNCDIISNELSKQSFSIFPRLSERRTKGTSVWCIRPFHGSEIMVALPNGEKSKISFPQESEIKLGNTYSCKNVSVLVSNGIIASTPSKLGGSMSKIESAKKVFKVINKENSSPLFTSSKKSVSSSPSLEIVKSLTPKKVKNEPNGTPPTTPSRIESKKLTFSPFNKKATVARTPSVSKEKESEVKKEKRKRQDLDLKECEDILIQPQNDEEEERDMVEEMENYYTERIRELEEKLLDQRKKTETKEMENVMDKQQNELKRQNLSDQLDKLQKQIKLQQWEIERLKESNASLLKMNQNFVSAGNTKGISDSNFDLEKCETFLQKLEDATGSFDKTPKQSEGMKSALLEVAKFEAKWGMEVE
eukprot:TRINITY_DN3545_c0_g1_i1.p1 TRINITY_DN3545_c0_g1~~TRINITY_DN3545_c0_g1_i1.p1  ORF type:complete len:424 (-),score=178.35 TRINITY_DN3545_c0_g1_i1:28-1299(-)